MNQTNTTNSFHQINYRNNNTAAAIYQLINGQANSILLETSRIDSENTKTFIFRKPITVLQIYSLDEVSVLFSRIEELLAKGFFLAGYFTYESGYHFESITEQNQFDFPIAWFGVYQEPIIFDHALGTWQHSLNDNNIQPPTNNFISDEFSVKDIVLHFDNTNNNTLHGKYVDRITTIKQHIASGNVYQINFTGRFRFRFDGSTIAYYDSLKKKQSVPYSAFLQTEYGTIISLSPELFFARHKDKVITQPMKGTARRGKTLQEDTIVKNWLANDQKNRAENVMIVDVLRNDLGKISEPGSVMVTSLYAIEKYNTLFQMTSTVESRLKSKTTYYNLFRAMFPSGSVTGAPKIRAMQLIHELEETPRGIYTGAIGYFSPHQEAVFNVAIRTVTLRNSRGEMGTGGGIVWDSNPDEELNECKLKAEFLHLPADDFVLIETILWDNVFLLLDKHLDRLTASAEYFDFPFDRDSALTKLSDLHHQHEREKKYKVRLTLDRKGIIAVDSHEIEPEIDVHPSIVGVSSVRTLSSDRFLFHKTSRRLLYDNMYRAAVKAGLADTIFLNEHDQVTEGSISNVFIEKNGVWHTPPIECGLLNGVYRQHLLETLPKVSEKFLVIEDIIHAEAIYICNSIRGLRKVILSLYPQIIGDNDEHSD